MRARPSDPKPGWLLSGRWYATEAEYLAALERRDARRQRLLALIETERAGGEWEVEA